MNFRAIVYNFHYMVSVLSATLLPYGFVFWSTFREFKCQSCFAQSILVSTLLCIVGTVAFFLLPIFGWCFGTMFRFCYWLSIFRIFDIGYSEWISECNMGYFPLYLLIFSLFSTFSLFLVKNKDEKFWECVNIKF